jgi:hypothetical protein
MSPAEVNNPLFARCFDRFFARDLGRGEDELRRELLAGLAGEVLEVGPGNGINFEHYPASVAGLVAVEPEPYLRGRAAEAAGAAPVATVLTGDQRGRAEGVGVAGARIKLVLLSSIFGGLALIVMAILLATIISLAVEQRQRELTVLRTIGATPRQVRRLVVRATTRPALVAAVAGAVAGPALAKLLFARMRPARGE